MEANPSSAEGAALAQQGEGGIVVPEYDSSASELKDDSDTGGVAAEGGVGGLPAFVRTADGVIAGGTVMGLLALVLPLFCSSNQCAPPSLVPLPPLSTP